MIWQWGLACIVAAAPILYWMRARRRDGGLGRTQWIELVNLTLGLVTMLLFLLYMARD
ncbi:hypothetical protein ACG04R_12505 [Roseateles sp. BYS78W]|uniref:Uncharacterized protein n=1 Tax=Pelomonas candidula TaxID=3299025 RepID=A0ABW7HCE9_9BURK